MEKREAPQMVYKGKTPQGYRVGIGINGAYGICPFCGKAYTEEDLKDPEIINFEHVYPRFAVKDAIKLVNRGNDKNKKSPEIEASVKVVVHKKCNSEGRELEDTIKTLIKSVNKGGQLTPEQAEKVLQYCRKTSVFLQYLTDWERVPESIFVEAKAKHLKYQMVTIVPDAHTRSTLSYDKYDEFVLYVGGVGFIYRVFPNKKKLYDVIKHPASVENSKFTITVLLDREKLHYVKYKITNDYWAWADLISFDKSICWKLGNQVRWDFRCANHLGYLPSSDSRINPEQYRSANPLLKKRLSLGGEYRGDMDDDIFFIQNGELYVYQQGVKYKLEDAKKYSSYLFNEMGLTKLPDMSDCVIESSFICDSNELTTLEGAPRRVNAIFACRNNKLVTLKGRPEYVGLDFFCSGNLLTTLEDPTKDEKSDFEVKRHFDCSCNRLKNLKGAPKRIGGHFKCTDNKLTTLRDGPKDVGGGYECSRNQLRTLEGAPECVSWFGCHSNKLTSLKFAPKYVTGIFYCYRNQLTTLDGAPEQVGEFDCRHNKLITLRGAPRKIGGGFACEHNKLKSFGCPDTIVQGNFYFDAKCLESLDGLPQAGKYLVADCGKEFDTADELRAWFAEYKKQRDGKKSIVTGLRAGTARVSAAGAVQETKRNTKPDNQKKK